MELKGFISASHEINSDASVVFVFHLGANWESTRMINGSAITTINEWVEEGYKYITEKQMAELIKAKESGE